MAPEELTDGVLLGLVDRIVTDTWRLGVRHVIG